MLGLTKTKDITHPANKVNIHGINAYQLVDINIFCIKYVNNNIPVM